MSATGCCGLSAIGCCGLSAIGCCGFSVSMCDGRIASLFFSFSFSMYGCTSPSSLFLSFPSSFLPLPFPVSTIPLAPPLLLFSITTYENTSAALLLALNSYHAPLPSPLPPSAPARTAAQTDTSSSDCPAADTPHSADTAPAPSLASIPPPFAGPAIERTVPNETPSAYRLRRRGACRQGEEALRSKGKRRRKKEPQAMAIAEIRALFDGSSLRKRSMQMRSKSGSFWIGRKG